MKSIAFISFPGHMAGLPSLGAGRALGLQDLRLQIVALRIDAAIAGARAANAAAAPPPVEPTPVPEPQKPRRKTGRGAAKPIHRARPVHLRTGTGG